jgi:hypothetical protein
VYRLEKKAKMSSLEPGTTEVLDCSLRELGKKSVLSEFVSEFELESNFNTNWTEEI